MEPIRRNWTQKAKNSCAAWIRIVTMSGAVLVALNMTNPAFALNFCAPLPPPSGPTVIVTPAQAAQLPSIIASATSGTTILLEDGTYTIGDSSLWISTSSVTLRSRSGNRSAVVLDGQYQTAAMIDIAASDVTIADLTIQSVLWHPIHLVGNGHRAMLYNLHLMDAGQQYVKINPSGTPLAYNDYGTVACSLIELTDAGRAHVDTVGGTYPCYTGGIDGHQAWGWNIRDNVFKNIYCTNGSVAEHAVHFWDSSRGTVVERNRIINCARGIGFGLGSTGPTGRSYPDNPLQGVSGYVGHIGGVIRNNFIFGDIGGYFNVGIGIEQALDAKISHNTVFSAGGTFSSIDSNFPNTNAVIRNNLVFPAMTVRNEANPTRQNNVESAGSGLFVDEASGNLHLVSTARVAIDQGMDIRSEVPSDMDGDVRDSQPDVGADEFVKGGSPVPDSIPPSNPQGLKVK